MGQMHWEQCNNVKRKHTIYFLGHTDRTYRGGGLWLVAPTKATLHDGHSCLGWANIGGDEEIPNTWETVIWCSWEKVEPPGEQQIQEDGLKQLGI